jgi:hypothetical protein
MGDKLVAQLVLIQYELGDKQLGDKFVAHLVPK